MYFWGLFFLKDYGIYKYSALTIILFCKQTSEVRYQLILKASFTSALVDCPLCFVQATYCPKWRRRWAHQRGLCLTWASSATAATGRKCYSDICITFKAKRSPSKVSENTELRCRFHVYWSSTKTHQLEMKPSVRIGKTFTTLAHVKINFSNVQYTHIIYKNIINCCNILLMHRDQSGNCCQSGGHCEHPAVSSDAEVLEGKTLGVEATGTFILLILYIYIILLFFFLLKFIVSLILFWKNIHNKRSCCRILTSKWTY